MGVRVGTGVTVHGTGVAVHGTGVTVHGGSNTSGLGTRELDRQRAGAQKQKSAAAHAVGSRAPAGAGISKGSATCARLMPEVRTPFSRSVERGCDMPTHAVVLADRGQPSSALGPAAIIWSRMVTPRRSWAVPARPRVTRPVTSARRCLIRGTTHVGARGGRARSPHCGREALPAVVARRARSERQASASPNFFRRQGCSKRPPSGEFEPGHRAPPTIDVEISIFFLIRLCAAGFVKVGGVVGWVRSVVVRKSPNLKETSGKFFSSPPHLCTHSYNRRGSDRISPPPVGKRKGPAVINAISISAVSSWYT